MHLWEFKINIKNKLNDKNHKVSGKVWELCQASTSREADFIWKPLILFCGLVDSIQPQWSVVSCLTKKVVGSIPGAPCLGSLQALQRAREGNWELCQ